MSFTSEEFIKSSPPPKYYPNDEAKIRGIAKEEIRALLEDKEFLALLKEKLKP